MKQPQENRQPSSRTTKYLHAAVRDEAEQEVVTLEVGCSITCLRKTEKCGILLPVKMGRKQNEALRAHSKLVQLGGVHTGRALA